MRHLPFDAAPRAHKNEMFELLEKEEGTRHSYRETVRISGGNSNNTYIRPMEKRR